MSLRKFARLLGVVAVLYPFATCTDFTGPSGRGVQVPVAPTFSAAATFAKALYSSAGIEFDRVRVLIVRGEGEILKDTTVAFSPTSAELTLPLVVSAAPGEVVRVTLEYRNPDVVLYSGTATVTTQPIAVTSASTTPIVLVPVGPGATAETVQISPNGGSFPTTAAVPFTAQAFAAGGASISNAIFGWSVDDASIATVNAQGVLQPTTKGGTVHVRATTLNTKFAEAAITFVTAPASVAVQSGGNQSAMSFEPLPASVVVKVLDVNGNGVPGATVNFAVLSGGGTITVLNEISDPAGLASVKWTLGDVVGTQSITATAAALPNAPLTINATGAERPAVALAFGQQPTKSLMGAAIMPAVTVKAIDDKGRTVSGFAFPIAISFDANPTSSTMGGTASTNAVAGVAAFSDLTVTKAGTGYTLKATANGLTQAISSSFDVDQVPSGLSLFAGGSQTAAIRSTLSQVAVKVADANGIGVAGITVAFAVVSGNGSIVVDNGVTDAQGLAKVTWTLGDDLGAQSISATSVGLTGSPLTITATATSLPAIGLAFVQGPPASVEVNATMSPSITVKAIDADGKTVTGFTGSVVLTLQNNPNNATLGGTLNVAAINGVATFPDLAVSAPGSGYALKATSGTLTTATSGTFVVSPPPAVGLKFIVQPANIQAGSTLPQVQVAIVDANGATVPGSTNPVTIGLANPLLDVVFFGTKTVSAVNGVATFSDLVLGTVFTGLTLKATAPPLAEVVSSAFTIAAAPAPARAWTGSISTNWHDANNWSPAGIPTSTDSVTIAAGTNQPVIGATASVGSIMIGSSRMLRINGVSLTVYHGVTNDGTLELTDGSVATTMTVNDSLVNHSGATINIAAGGSGPREIIGVLRNYGSVNVPSTGGLMLSHVGSGSVNAGSITFTGGGPLTLNYTDTTSSFTNTSTGTISLGVSAWEIWNGHLELRAGTVSGTGLFITHQSQLDIDISRLPLSYRIDAYTLFAGDSIVVPTGVTRAFQGSTLTQKVVVLGTLNTLLAEEGPVYFEGGVSIKTGGTLEAQGDANVSGGFVIEASATLRVVARDEERYFTVASAFTNNGLIELTSTGLYLTALETNGSMLTNATTGTIRAIGGFGGERRIVGKLDNRGTISVDADSYLRFRSGSTGNTNSGTITLLGTPTPGETAEYVNSFDIEATESATVLTNTGTISIGANRTVYVDATNTLVNATGGVVGGVGTLHVNDDAFFTNNGTLAPGGVGVAGTLTVDGNWIGGSGTLSIDVGGSSSGQYDLLRVTKTATMGGTLQVQTINDYSPDFNPFPVIIADVGYGGAFETNPPDWSDYLDGGFHIYYNPPASPPSSRATRRPPDN